MSRQYTPRARRNLLATSAEADLVIALEITHEDLEVPVRVVNDTQDLVITVAGDPYPEAITFVACPFDITLPDDVDQQIPRARLSVDNIGRELTQWLEYSRGGKGAKVRILQATRSDVEPTWSYGPYADVDLDYGPYVPYADVEYMGTDYANDLTSSDPYMSTDYAYGPAPEEHPWEADMTLDMSSIKIDNISVSADLGVQDMFRRPAVSMRFDPKTAPGVF